MGLDLVTFSTVMNNFGNFSPDCHIALAVSGGPDSMVLSHLIKNWLKQYPKAQLTALIIDHGLRPESSIEAQLTQNRLKEMGIKSEIIPWVGQKPTTRIQERARQERYRLLETWCKKNGVIHLLTGHHLDDQWETIISRLQKNSSHIGLRGILPKTYRQFGRILRPLLKFSKQVILDYAAQQDIKYAIDPSNQNVKYQRVYLRKNRQILEQNFMSIKDIQILIQDATQRTEKLLKDLTNFILASVKINPLGYIQINQSDFNNLSDNLQIEFLKHVAACMTPISYPFPRSKAQNTIQKIKNGQRTTMAGWYIIPQKQNILIVREPRAMLPQTTIKNGIRRIDRFIVSEEKKDNLIAKDLPSYIQRTIPKGRGLILNFLTPLLP